MAELHFLEFDIFLSDAAQVAALQGNNFGAGQAQGAIIAAPEAAAITYSAPIREKGESIDPPCITSSWFSSGDNFPRDVATFERKTGGWFGISFLFGTTHRYYWRGLFKYVAPLSPSSPSNPTPDAIAQRRWCEGFEAVAQSVTVARGASRHTQGFGLALRDSTAVFSHTTADFAVGFTPSTSWERFYIRPRVWPNTQKVFWRTRISVSASAGLALALTPSGQIALFQSDASGVLSLLGTASRSTVIDEWMRIDVLHKTGTGAACYLFLNGQNQMSLTGLGTEVAIAGRTHASSEVGSSGAATWALDIDDWICADWPASAPLMSNPGPDWLSGSRVAAIRPTGFAPSNVWTGDYKVLLQTPVSGAGFAVTTELTSIVSGATLAVTTDYDAEVRGDPNGQIGIASMMVGIFAAQAGALDGQLGYSIGGAAPVLATINQGVTPQWNYVMYRPSGLAVGIDIFPLELVHTKTLDALSESVAILNAQIEVLGTFGTCDIPAHVTSFEALIFQGATPNIHNAPYPRTPWARSKVPPIAPIAIYGGTYVGDAAGVELSFKTPIHFWWVRRVTILGQGNHWFSSSNAAHDGMADSVVPELMVQAAEDEAFVAAPGEDAQETSYTIKITGAHVQANNPGDTYAYTAVSDPGGRFLLCGALKHHKGTTAIDTALLNASFLPECAFFLRDGNTGAVQMFYKGPGHATASASILNAAETANAITFSLGHLVSQSAFHNASTDQISYALFRREDGNTQDPTSTDPYTEVLQLASYTGDGTASRTISLAPASGKRPLFAIVVPHNAASIYRDHANLTNTSQTAPATNTTTGITGGGIDSISVGTTLNTNGIVYDVFVLPGGDVAGNGGFSVPGEFFPRPPDTPTGGPYDPQPTDPDDAAPDEEPVPPDTATPVPAWPTGCVGATTQLVNMALARLGHTKFIVDVSAEQTVEAALARMFYVDVVNAVLRAFPWPFATRYATLTLAAGTAALPVNEDWQYAYRAPADQLFVRRFVRRGTGLRRSYDPLPVTFRMGSDATGDLIYANAEAIDALVEYTAAPTCAATAGDELFRSAVAWRLAHELAPGLSKDDNRAKLAWAMYERQIETAKTVGANEQEPDRDDHDASWIEDRNS